MAARPKTGPALKRIGGNVREGLSDAVVALRRETQRPDLVLIPQDLRTADPSLFAEIAAGTMGLAGATANIDGRSPFSVPPPTPAWQAALLGFGWLSDLRASGSADAQALGRFSTLQWLSERRPPSSIDWQPAIAARRLMSWLANAGMLTEGAASADYERILEGFDAHMSALAEMAGGARGFDRLNVHIALAMGALCLTDQEPRLAPAVKGLATDLDRQIMASGLHVTRNGSVMIELMLDLLPLKQCFLARDREPPAPLIAALARMAPMLRHLQLGDRALARFNGVGMTEIDKLSAVLSYDVTDGKGPRPADISAASRYFRLARRKTVVLMDGGPPPQGRLSGTAGAGALSFEMSSGSALIVVNAGAPSPAGEDWRLQSRGTAAHSTMVMNETASSRLVQDPKIVDGGPPHLQGPALVEARLMEPGDGTVEVQGQHNGYAERFGMAHARVLSLSAQGNKLTGTDRIYQPQRLVLSGQGDRSFALHFHLHPRTRAKPGAQDGMVELTLTTGETWVFTSSGLRPGIEDSLFFATFTSAIRSLQIVLRGHAREDTQVRWTLERLEKDAPKVATPPPAPKLPKTDDEDDPDLAG